MSGCYDTYTGTEASVWCGISPGHLHVSVQHNCVDIVTCWMATLSTGGQEASLWSGRPGPGHNPTQRCYSATHHQSQLRHTGLCAHTWIACRECYSCISYIAPIIWQKQKALTHILMLIEVYVMLLFCPIFLLCFPTTAFCFYSSLTFIASLSVTGHLGEVWPLHSFNYRTTHHTVSLRYKCKLFGISEYLDLYFTLHVYFLLHLHNEMDDVYSFTASLWMTWYTLLTEGNVQCFL